ncbi:hypothetical protein J2X76_006100 [Neorhizobium sp. 2083]|nr:hypothetical protein [Neorhizobium sp. 2083]
MSTGEIIDPIHAAPIFRWANRLMYALGHSDAVK